MDCEWLHTRTESKGSLPASMLVYLFLSGDGIRPFGGKRDLANWRAPDGRTWLPLYEAKFAWHYDHRFGSYHAYGKAKGRGGRGLPPVTEPEHADPNFRIDPQFWFSAAEIGRRFSSLEWKRDWLLGFRRITSSKV